MNEPGPSRLDRFRGSLLALALADAIGAYYEGGITARLLWRALGAGKGKLLRYTDDTQMALVLAESLAVHGRVDPDALSDEWAAAFDLTRGYGAGTIRMFRLVRKGTPWREANRAAFPDGSLGNGAAMRAAPLGLFYAVEPESLATATRRASEVTHAHPLGIEGGVLIAAGTALALRDEFTWDALASFATDSAYRSKIEAAPQLGDASPKEVRKQLGNGIRATESAITAAWCFDHFRARSFSELMEFVVAVGGDTDTIGAMAGGMWGAANGVEALPADLMERLEDRERIDRAAQALFSASERGPTS